MKLSIYFLTLFASLISIYSFGQNEKITVILLKGNSSFIRNRIQIELKKSILYSFENNDILKVVSNSNLIAYNDKSHVEIGGQKDQFYNHQQLNDILHKQKSEGIAFNFVKYLNKIYKEEKNKEISSGYTIGAASRGITNAILPSYFPDDNTIILSDSLTLKFDNKNSFLVSNIIIINQDSQEIIFDSTINDNKIILKGLKSGKYIWKYKLESIDKKIYDYENIFIVPNAIEKNRLLKEISDFNKYLDSSKEFLSNEVRKILKKEFYEINRIYTTELN
jgi:hypothetical protein